MFLFQIGAIKTFNHKKGEQDENNKFLFQIGAIKTRMLRRIVVRYESFYSRLVRLKLSMTYEA